MVVLGSSAYITGEDFLLFHTFPISPSLQDAVPHPTRRLSLLDLTVLVIVLLNQQQLPNVAFGNGALMSFHRPLKVQKKCDKI